MMQAYKLMSRLVLVLFWRIAHNPEYVHNIVVVHAVATVSSQFV